MALVILKIEYADSIIRLSVLKTKYKGRYSFNYTLKGVKVTIIKECPGLMEEEGVIDYEVLKTEVNKRVEEVFEMLMER